MANSSEPEATVCRLCDENNDKLFSVFEKNGLHLPIIDIIREYLPIIIYKNDPLSKFVCQSCIENLNMFHEFRKTCLDIAHKHEKDMQAGHNNDPDVLNYLKQCNGSEINENEADENECAFRLNGSMMEEGDNISLPSINGHPSESDVDNLSTYKVDDNNSSSSLILQKPRISGPKSITKKYQKQCEVTDYIYEPLTLMELTINWINSSNIDNYEVLPYTKEIETGYVTKFCCRYCNDIFDKEEDLAIHELNVHIQLCLKRIDADKIFNKEDDKMDEDILENSWIDCENKTIKTEVPECDSILQDSADTSLDSGGLLVPKKEEPINPDAEPTLDVSRNSFMYFVGDIPYCQGKPLKKMPKDQRYKYYKTLRMSGVRRKFCQLCRYTFKDNWAIDVHYFSNVCYYSCNYCGVKFKRYKEDFPAHIKAHEDAGDQKSLNVFSTNEFGEIVEYDNSCLEPYIPPSVQQTLSPPKPTKPVPLKSLPKPSPMTLRVRQPIPPTPPSPPLEPLRRSMPVASSSKMDVKSGSNDLLKNQAYFCKNCYQVFTKLDSYNIHKRNCNGDDYDSEVSLIKPNNTRDLSNSTKSKPQVEHKKITVKKELPPLRPINNATFPHVKIKEEVGVSSDVNRSQPKPSKFICVVCEAAFSTAAARANHMRVHERHRNMAQNATPATSRPIQGAKKRPAESQTVSTPKRIKTVSYEPIVEIHEGTPKIPNNIGSVSITPLKRNSNSGTLNVSPDILKLVRENPNISFKPVQHESPVQVHHQQPVSQQPPRPQLRQQPQHQDQIRINPVIDSPSADESDPSKRYKCAACNRHFPNKSNLYFHKKDNCSGSRFPCPFCKKRFGTAAEYSSHIFYSHPE